MLEGGFNLSGGDIKLTAGNAQNYWPHSELEIAEGKESDRNKDEKSKADKKTVSNRDQAKATGRDAGRRSS